ncbi:MAG: type VII toxin-antitoxin system MntA family adenylyltransferase antitoxin [Candidatus Margulisiibacteriota bacterium]
MNGLLEILKSYFEKKSEISMAFLFGSAAGERLIPESDADVAVWFAVDYTLDDVNRLQMEIEQLLHRNVDLIVLNSARPTIAWEAIRGKPLLIRSYRLYLRKLLEFSTEAEDFTNFILDLWSWRRRLRGAFA